jgi:hypothetical protein
MRAAVDSRTRPPSEFGHLVRRFFGSLWPAGPPPRDEAWAADHLLPGEVALWRRMSGPDRRHAVGVARRAAVCLGPAATRPVMAAALLHDVGKIDSGLGAVSRAAVTLAAKAAGGHTAGERWRHRPGMVGRAGRYLCHDAIGARMLGAAGSDGLTVTWAREHHLPPARWTVSEDLAAALKAADDD